MIEILTDTPENVLAVRATGKVTAEDYDHTLVPALEQRLQTRDRIRMFYELGPEAGFSVGAMWEDAKVGIRHLKAFERIAVVSDLKWVNGAVRSFAWLIPCPVRVFPTSERATALAWING
ncbi:MAG TPA: STAS/SEC14 domain-containing protein [Planctomycetota bacterium]|nr:STAS/SEC14 domain-containing protein [Planctomycetota bacterium]